MQSSGGWDDVVDPNSPVTQLLKEKEKEKKRILVKTILCLVLLNLLIKNYHSLGQR